MKTMSIATFYQPSRNPKLLAAQGPPRPQLRPTLSAAWEGEVEVEVNGHRFGQTYDWANNPNRHETQSPVVRKIYVPARCSLD